MTADPAAVRASLADATPDVFWTDRPERPSPRASLTGAGHRADLVVVGGGFTGLWAAIQAKEGDPSRDVVVLERGRFGVAASGRNGGFVASSLTHGLAQGLACWPDEIATLERLADENRAGLENGRRVSRHDLLARNPDIADELAACLDDALARPGTTVGPGVPDALRRCRDRGLRA